MTEQSTASRSPAGQATEAAADAGAAAQERAQQAAGQARDAARRQVDERSTQAGEQLSATAGDVRTVGEELRRQGKDKPAQLADQAAERVERLGGYLKESDADRILTDLEDFGRRQPWAVAAGGLALGFLASRFLKASSQKRYESGQAERQVPPRPRYAGDGVGSAPPPVARPGQPGPIAGPGL